MACCLDCHFKYEEREAFPHLPPKIKHLIYMDHVTLRQRGYPPTEVAEHAEREMEWFRIYVPADVVAKIENDHHKYYAEQGIAHPDVAWSGNRKTA